MKIALLTPTQREGIVNLMMANYNKFIFETDTPLRERVMGVKGGGLEGKYRMAKSRILQEIQQPDFSKDFFECLIDDLKLLNYLYMTEIRKEVSRPDFIELLILELLRTCSEETIEGLAGCASRPKRVERLCLEERVKKAIEKGDIVIHSPEHAIEYVKAIPPVFYENSQKGRVYRLLHYYRRYWTSKEIADKLKLNRGTKSTINKLIKQLLKDGVIECDNSSPPKYRCTHHL